MAILLVCVVNTEGKRVVLAVKPMLEVPGDSYKQLFERLKERGLRSSLPWLSLKHTGAWWPPLGSASPALAGNGVRCISCGTSWLHVSHKAKERFVRLIKGIWLTTDLETAKQRAQELADLYHARCPKAIETLEACLEDSLIFLSFPLMDARKVSSNNMLERLTKEIRRRTRVVGIFPNPKSYLWLVIVYLMEYSDN